MIRPIEYCDYDKISDDILYLGSKLYLRMNVSLSNKDGNMRYHFHKEYNYDSEYANDNNGLVSVRRSFNYYLTFDKIDEKKSIMIRPQDMIILQNKLSKVQEWFSNGTFGVVDGDIAILKKRRPIVVNGLVQNQYLEFEPMIIVYEDPLVKVQGVQITLGDPLIYASVNVDNFFGMVYTLSNFRMFESAQQMINYLGRPDFGTNISHIQSNRVYNQPKQAAKKKKSNAPTKNVSFFS